YFTPRMSTTGETDFTPRDTPTGTRGDSGDLPDTHTRIPILSSEDLPTDGTPSLRSMKDVLNLKKSDLQDYVMELQKYLEEQRVPADKEVKADKKGKKPVFPKEDRGEGPSGLGPERELPRRRILFSPPRGERAWKVPKPEPYEGKRDAAE